MATNITFKPGDHQSLPVPAGTKSGDPVRVGVLNGVAVTDVAKTDVSPFNTDGTRNTAYNAGGGNPDGYASVWLVGAPTFNVTGTGITPGAAIYFNAAAAAGAPKLTATDPGGVDALPRFGAALTTGVASGTAGVQSVVVRIEN
ncbi:hypothetical protein GCM10009785_26780 [Brooklawnia cerclae]|uniref:RecA/RadA family phage recombinase n=1 Tax=Brooklawnia cerclae TaxID=349934 RepID=A0ABX0SG10_9ACTN|nr:hypothetical protein [Brooklawnia cerclae]NIH57313.1 putative RecA/RadA family phage recombinase [Brooklawnia cerclae]